MDFRTDEHSATIGDQFMFGPAFLVNPVTDPGVDSRRVYLPKAKWHDFWSGSSIKGPRMVEAAAPIDKLPLFVRAGAIVPMGPEKQWSTEKPEDPIELRIYRGADGDSRSTKMKTMGTTTKKESTRQSRFTGTTRNRP